MSRPFSRIKLGYYPLPVEEARNIKTLLIPSAAYSAIDPCAGDSTALVELTGSAGAHLAALDARLVETASHATLAANEAAISRAFAARTDQTFQLAAARKALSAAAREVEGAGASLTEAEAARDEAMAAVVALTRDIQAVRSRRAALDPATLDVSSRSLHGLAAHVGEAQDTFQQIAALTTQCNHAAARLKASEDSEAAARAQIAVLEPERGRLDQALSALAPLAALATASLSEAAQHLRHTLVEGAPCPVCGAHEHPLLAADTAAARLARETLVRRQALDGDIARTAREHTLASTTAAKAHVEAVHLKGVVSSFVESIASADRKLRDIFGLLAREAATCGFKVAFDPMLPEAAREGLTTFAQHIEDSRGSIDAKLTQASGLARDIERIEAELTRATKARDDAGAALETARRQATTAEQGHAIAAGRVALLDGQLAANGADLADVLETAGLTLAKADRDLKSASARVLALGSDHRAANAGRIKAADLIAELKAQAHAAEVAVASARDALVIAEKVHAGHEHALAPLRAARAALLGGEALDAHKSRLTAAEAKAREALDAARLTASAAEADRSAALAHHSSTQAALKVADDAARSASERFTSAAAAIGQSVETVAVHLAIPKAESCDLRARLSALDATLSSAAGTLATRQRDLDVALADGDTPDAGALAGLITEREHIGHARDLITRRVAEIGQTLRLDDEARLKAAAHTIEIAAAEAEHAVWADVNAAIGESTGARFRRFAQSVTLRELLAIGDRKLGDLNPRYGLKQGSVSDLGIEIVDRDMVEEVRSPRSLSGGERFLVSLALALALAELEGKHSFVDTLFIDEGFGSLDRDTLDSAIDALERLQDQGRKVGVVTHVAAMIERIGIQVRVERQGGGRSRVRVVDGAGRAG